MGQKVYKELKSRGFSVGPIPVSQAQSTVKRMQDIVFQIVNIESQRMNLDRQEAQQAVDNIEEYRYVQSKCPRFNGAAALRTSQ